MNNVFYIGPVPAEEACAQVGTTPDHLRLNRLECKAYIAALRKVYGAEPEGALLRGKSENHDFGTYLEVVVQFDNSDAAVAYAEKCDQGLARWEDAGMWAPVTYREGGHEVLMVLEDAALWDRSANPQCMPTLERMREAGGTP